MKDNALKTALIHMGLFLLTFLTTTLAGAEYRTGKGFLYNLEWADMPQGFPYALSFLAFLTVHEFGHYFTAVYYRVKTSLPYYIPFFIPGLLANIGTMGAVIRLKSIPKTTREFFDIGVAGPLAGFVVSFCLLAYGFMTLPNLQAYVVDIHPEYIEQFGGVPSEEQLVGFFEKRYAETDSIGGAMIVGSSLLFEWMKNTLPSDAAQVPPPYEIMHYPFLFVGFITLFFTALNLLPIGQLDGGHVTYGLFGRKGHSIISRLTVFALLFIGGTGFPDLKSAEIPDLIQNGVYLIFLTFVMSKLVRKDQPIFLLGLILGTLIAQIAIKWLVPTINGNFLWLLYSFMAVQFIGLDHPPAEREHKLSLSRQIMGWVAIVIFILCFTPVPVDIIGPIADQ
ncbi:MAG: site-2 protease family protein [Bacteroidota bacterium]